MGISGKKSLLQKDQNSNQHPLKVIPSDTRIPYQDVSKIGCNTIPNVECYNRMEEQNEIVNKAVRRTCVGKIDCKYKENNEKAFSFPNLQF